MIRIRDLVKDYGKRRAVDGISFDVEQGEIVGFLGPNGAGKTTTMRIITGYLMPTSGDVSVAGHDMTTESLAGRRLIGYMPETTPLYSDMTTRSYLEYAAALRGLDRSRIGRRVDAVVEQCRLEEYLDVATGKLSRGFRQRVGVAQAIIHEPRVLILDEPTVGIDPIQVAQTRDLIRDLARRHTILLSTHILPEVSMLCERVIIIHRGRIVAQDRIGNLSALLRSGSRIRLRVQGPADQVTRALQAIEGVESVEYREPHHVVAFPSDREPQAAITQALVRGGWTLLAMETVEMSLEEIFLEVTGREARQP